MGKRIVIAALTGVVLAGAAVIAVTASGSGTEKATPQSAASTFGLALLGQPQDAADVLPPGFDAAGVGSGGVSRDSVRVLQSGTAGTFWVGVDGDGRLCLFGALPGGTAIAGSACTSADRFHGHAVELRIAGGGAAAEAYLFPDAVSVRILDKALPETAVISGTGELLLVQPTAPPADRAALTAATKGVYDLGVLPTPAG